MPTAAIYARHSTDDKAHESSLSRQIDQCRVQASDLGFVISSEHIYQDELTGTLLDRPDLQRLLAFLSQCYAVFVYAHDRLSRVDWHKGYILHRLNEAGVVLYADGKPVESSLIAGMMSLVAQEERNNLTKRMDDGK